MAATLLYGLLAVFAILLWKGWHWRMLAILGAVSAIGLVGFSRIALGAHYLNRCPWRNRPGWQLAYPLSVSRRANASQAVGR